MLACNFLCSLSEKQAPCLAIMEQSKRCQRSLWSHRASSPQPRPNLTGYASTEPWCCHLKVCTSGWLWKHLSMIRPSKQKLCVSFLECGYMLVTCIPCKTVSDSGFYLWVCPTCVGREAVETLCATRTLNSNQRWNWNVLPCHQNAEAFGIVCVCSQQFPLCVYKLL